MKISATFKALLSENDKFGFTLEVSHEDFGPMAEISCPPRFSTEAKAKEAAEQAIEILKETGKFPNFFAMPQ